MVLGVSLFFLFGSHSSTVDSNTLQAINDTHATESGAMQVTYPENGRAPTLSGFMGGHRQGFRRYP